MGTFVLDAARSLFVVDRRDEEKADPSPPSAKRAAGFGMTDNGSCAVNFRAEAMEGGAGCASVGGRVEW
jgi:hypothetical protein